MDNRRNIAAYTGSSDIHPEFINVTELEDGNISVTARAQGTDGNPVTEIVMSMDVFKAFLETLNDNIDE